MMHLDAVLDLLSSISELESDFWYTYMPFSSPKIWHFLITCGKNFGDAFFQKVPKSESPPLHTIRRSACPDSIFRTQGNAITSPHFRTYVFDLFSCSTCLTCLLVSFSPAVQSMYLNHLPLVSQIIPINSNVGVWAIYCKINTEKNTMLFREKYTYV